MTKIIGITGGIGTGKSTVAEYLKEKGYPVIDADEIGRRISRSRETVREIESRFGTEYVGKEGLDRKAVAALIFSIDMPERTVSIYALELVAYEYPRLVIRAHVSSGTYIRSLAVDIGQKLGSREIGRASCRERV